MLISTHPPRTKYSSGVTVQVHMLRNKHKLVTVSKCLNHELNCYMSHEAPFTNMGIRIWNSKTYKDIVTTYTYHKLNIWLISVSTFHGKRCTNKTRHIGLCKVVQHITKEHLPVADMRTIKLCKLTWFVLDSHTWIHGLRWICAWYSLYCIMIDRTGTSVVKGFVFATMRSSTKVKLCGILMFHWAMFDEVAWTNWNLRKLWYMKGAWKLQMGWNRMVSCCWLVCWNYGRFTCVYVVTNDLKLNHISGLVFEFVWVMSSMMRLEIQSIFHVILTANSPKRATCGRPRSCI